MNNRAQIGFMAIVIAAVAILIGLAFWANFAGNIGQMTKTSSSTNVSFTMPANGSTSDLTPCYQKALTYELYNGTTAAVPTTNYTITQAAGTDGYLAARIRNNDAAWNSKAVNVTCTYEPFGYIPEGGSRGIVTLIAIFMALLIVVAALPDVRNGILDFFKG